jgi:hypothetical protein
VTSSLFSSNNPPGGLRDADPVEVPGDGPGQTDHRRSRGWRMPVERLPATSFLAESVEAVACSRDRL